VKEARATLESKRKREPFSKKTFADTSETGRRSFTRLLHRRISVKSLYAIFHCLYTGPGREYGITRDNLILNYDNTLRYIERNGKSCRTIRLTRIRGSTVI